MKDWLHPFLHQQRVAHLAAVDEHHRPHVVPIVHAFDGERLCTPIDARPKQVGAQRLRRVRNIQANPEVTVLVDHYEEDWRRLAWVQLRGAAVLVASGQEQETGISLLEAKYPQYAEMPLAGRPIIVVTVEDVVSWRADEAIH
ncbi:MAG: TIGR03668 family PPOX class F420-dependent oxidoreductase [Chloroflexota bacterium]